ncbi:cysteine hydrolase family protein [Pseudomonas sp. sp1636]|uniref:cysteine hydrolase family protein n=1 Tax=Pseudomonas sp. sp1636 TaxID=3036707 RepID=UPI0025A52B21|nr:cysteine hydrolase family protein [Pseudomonas sp. sp1636]MDM8348732.1 cysteine hydrolase family protein [Pseudomonas sp. sp1636]
MTTALLIIDVQQALCTGAEAAFDIDRVIARINRVAEQARAAGLPIVLLQHEESHGSLRFGTQGWQLAEGLVTSPDDLRMRKSTPDSFLRTDLNQRLQEWQITRLLICGLQSDYCVDTTTRRALALGYEVVLVADAHSTVDNGVLCAAQITAHHNATLANITSFGARAVVVPAADVRVEV